MTARRSSGDPSRNSAGLDVARRIAGRKLAAAAGPHPEPGRLIAFAEQRLDEAEHGAVADHLAACPACVGLLRDFAGWERLADATVSDAEAESETGWQALRERLARSAPGAAAPGTAAPDAAAPGAAAPDAAAPGADDDPSALAEVVPLGARATTEEALADSAAPRSAPEAAGTAAADLAAPTRAGERVRGWALAAAIAAVLGAVWLLAGPLRTGLVPASQVNVAVAVLEPERTERSGGAVTEIALPAGARDLTLVLATAWVAPDASFEAAIEEPSGAVVWRADGLRQRADGTFALRLPVRLLGTDAYRLRLMAADAGTPAARYAFRLR